VYFEEWDEPHISAIRWVSELIGIAGGDDCFPELAQMPMVKAALDEAEKQLLEYKQVLTEKIQQPERLYALAVVALGYHLANQSLQIQASDVKLQEFPQLASFPLCEHPR
jgi:hypothetical protein